jgi:hypothetical protein
VLAKKSTTSFTKANSKTTSTMASAGISIQMEITTSANGQMANGRATESWWTRTEDSTKVNGNTVNS